MITGINGNNYVRNTNFLNNQKTGRVSFGRLEADDSFVKQNKENKPGIFSKIKQTVSGFIGSIKGKIVNAFLFVIKKGYRDKKQLEYIDNLSKQFIQTPEGIRRAKMSDKEIENEAKDMYNKSFDELDVPDELRPKLVFKSDNSIMAGFYKVSSHNIEINSKGYRNYPIAFDSAIMHEATHAKEALMRAGIPQKRVDEIVKNELLSNSNNLHILNPTNLSFMMPLDIPEGMKEDFDKFADENLFNKSEDINKALSKYHLAKEMQSSKIDPKEYTPIIRKIIGDGNKQLKSIFEGIDTLIQNNPEFEKSYGGKEKAFNALMDYSLALNTEYNIFTDTEIGGDFGTPPVKVKELKGEELKQAEKSLINSMDMIRSNLLYSAEVNKHTNAMYKFCDEEVLAETNGRNFLIKNYKEELEKNKENLTPDREKYLNLQIELSEKVIEYRTLGSEYLKLIKKFIKNTNDTELEEIINKKDEEIDKIDLQLTKLERKLASYNKQ